MPRRSVAQPTLQILAAQAIQLPEAERRELISILQAYNQAEAQAPPEKPQDNILNHRGIRGGKGSFEDKYINGYGPYRYLRYWYGKTHKSVYLGKVRSNLPDESYD